MSENKKGLLEGLVAGATEAAADPDRHHMEEAVLATAAREGLKAPKLRHGIAALALRSDYKAIAEAIFGGLSEGLAADEIIIRHKLKAAGATVQDAVLTPILDGSKVKDLSVAEEYIRKMEGQDTIRRAVAAGREYLGLVEKAKAEGGDSRAAYNKLVGAVLDIGQKWGLAAGADGTLADAWQAHLDRFAADKAGPREVLRLDAAKRGSWAEWINDYLGTRGGLEPGETFILGGGPETGKTSLAALLAVDALAVGCPVLFWELELSRVEVLEHLQAQLPEPANWWKTPFWNRARRRLPEAWADLLEVPRWPAAEAEAVQAAMLNMARRAECAIRAGKARHACRGLVIVDYAQLLTLTDAGPRNAQHEILSTAASRLAKAAAESGACLLLLSQLNKQDQRDATPAGTALAGADFSRMAYRVALLHKADTDGHACTDKKEVAWEKDKGEARLLTWTKARGVRYTEDGRRPDRARVIWNGGRSRAFHGGDTPAGGWGEE